MMLSMRSTTAVTTRRAALLTSAHHRSTAASALAAVAIANSSSSSTTGTQHQYFSTDAKPRKSLVTAEEGVHQTMKISKSWRNKPLFRRQGDVRFRTGTEASQLLISEANRRDLHLKEFIQVITSTMMCLSPIFERNPKYAFVAKTLMEPDRFVQFRVAWIDDTGVIRMNRGFRIQFSSSLGPYSGSLHFGSHVTNSLIKTLGFGQVFSNALTGFDMGAAVGGSDFNPLDKSEGELQRFCQSYITELTKYIGPDQDLPWMGMGVGKDEMAYMFGQYKRISAVGCPSGRQFLSPDFHWAPGYGVVHFANEMLQDKGESLQGKRCLIVGSGKVARSVADKLLQFGAIPLSFSDASGHVYEPNGISHGQLRTINSIKSERGALLGRYIISSTTAQFNDPPSIFDVPCDLCFPCGAMDNIDVAMVDKLADNGCQAVIEGGDLTVTSGARKALRKRGIMYGPSLLTLTGSAIAHHVGANVITDEILAEHVARIYSDVKSTASEFNARGDLYTGANIQGFLRVANVMMTHGAV